MIQTKEITLTACPNLWMCFCWKQDFAPRHKTIQMGRWPFCRFVECSAGPWHCRGLSQHHSTRSLETSWVSTTMIFITKAKWNQPRPWWARLPTQAHPPPSPHPIGSVSVTLAEQHAPGFLATPTADLSPPLASFPSFIPCGNLEMAQGDPSLVYHIWPWILPDPLHSFLSPQPLLQISVLGSKTIHSHGTNEQISFPKTIWANKY